MSAAPAIAEYVALDGLLDQEVPCSHNQPGPCQEGAVQVRACPRCRWHRFRCQAHYEADLARIPFREVKCGVGGCDHTATVAEVNATFRPV